MAAKTWSRTVLDANWSTALNWNGGTVPATTDVVTFDATSVLNCTVDALATFTGQIIVAAGYTGTVTQNVAIPSTAAFSIADGTWVQANTIIRTTFAVTGGTFTGGSQSITLSGTLTFSGGTLTMTSGTCTLSTGSFTQTNTPTFNANGGTIAFTGATAATLTGPNCTFNKITFSKSSVNFTVPNGTTCPLGTDPTNTLTNSSDFIINGTVTWAGTFTLTRGDIVTASTTVITVTGGKRIGLVDSLTFDAAATITTGIALDITGLNIASIVTATAYTFGTCTLLKNNTSGDLTVAVGTTIPFGTNSTTQTDAGTLTVNGTITMTGSWVHNGNLTVASGGTVTWTTPTTFSVDRSLIVNAAATFPNSIPTTFTGFSNTSIDATGVTFGAVTLGGQNAATLTIGVGTTISVGGGGTWTSGAMTVNGTLTVPTGVTITTSNVTIASGATLNGPGTIKHRGGTFTCNAGATVGSAPNITMSVFSAVTTGRTFAGGGKTYGTLTRESVDATATAATTITGTNTFAGIVDTEGFVAHTWTFPNVTTTVARFVVRGSSGNLLTLARTGAAGTFALTKNTVGSVVASDYLSISNSTVDAAPVWYAGANSTDGGGNTNWIFTAVPDKYWIGLGADNNWSTVLNWSDAIVPVTTDAVNFDATSTKACTVDNVASWSGGALNIKVGYTGTITQSVTMTSAAWSQAGNCTFIQGANIVTTTFALSDGGLVGSGGFSISCSGAVTLSGGSIIPPINFIVTEAAFTVTGTTWIGSTVSVTMTFTGGTGRTFAGGGKTYGSLTRSGSGAGTLTITGTNTFATFTDNAGLVAHTLIFPNVTTTIGAGSFNVSGSAGKLVTLARTGGAGVFTLTKASGNVTANYISVSNSTVDASPVWRALNSTDGGGNTNWIFSYAAKMRKSVMVIA